MILIVSLNFGIERIVRVLAEEAGIGTPPAILRAKLESRHASAKGINSARALLRLGYPARVLGLLGGWAGHFIEEDLKREGIQFIPIAIRGENRTCTVLRTESGANQMVINECGPDIYKDELQRIEQSYKEQVQEAQMVLLTGSLLPGIPEDFYARLIGLAHQAQKRVLLDAAGQALAQGIKALPHAIKINDNEASAWAGRPISDIPQAAEIAHFIVKQGISIAMITLGARGAVLCTAEQGLAYSVPSINSQNCVGAGDAALAGLSLALLQGQSIQNAGAFASAVATASTLHGAGRCELKEIQNILPQIHCMRLES